MRIGIDANILLRAILNDDPAQSSASRALLSGLHEDRLGHIGISALLEMFWVLRSRYRVPRDALCETIRDLLMTKNLEVESFDAVVRALALYEKGRADFQDALLAERNVDAGCVFTHTFDQGAAESIPAMRLLVGSA